jgi:hypothetical protein
MSSALQAQVKNAGLSTEQCNYPLNYRCSTDMKKQLQLDGWHAIAKGECKCQGMRREGQRNVIC